MADGRTHDAVHAAATRPPATARRDQPGVGGAEPGLADVVARLRRAMRRAARAARPTETLAVAQFELLQAVAEHPDPRAGKIANALRLSPNSVTTLVNSLADRGLLLRAPSQVDRRVVYLRLTEEGTQALDRWQTVNARVLDAALGALRPADRAAVEGALPALTRLIDELNRLE